MSGWNEILLKKIDTYSHRIISRVEEVISYIGTCYTTHKGIFLITLIVFCLLYILLTLRYKYREFNFPVISNFLYHISIVYGIGLLLSSVPKNVKWIGLVLELTPILFIIPIFLVVLYVRDRMLYWKSHTKHQMKLAHGFYMIGLVAIPFTITSPKWETVDF